MNIIKLGGSVITKKNEYRKTRLKTIRNLCSVFSKSRERTILIHGAGSFGHIKALNYGLNVPGIIEGKEAEISRVISDVLILDSILIDELNDRGVRAVAVPPHVIYGRDAPDFTKVRELLDFGFVPVLYGDIVLSQRRYKIVSGDEIALDLASIYKPKSVIFLTDVDGFFSSDPKKNADARLFRRIRATDIGKMDVGEDATGSMTGKIERIKKMVSYTSEVVVLNGNKRDNLIRYFGGREFKGTVIT